jgi:hypothetical protein
MEQLVQLHCPIPGARRRVLHVMACHAGCSVDEASWRVIRSQAVESPAQSEEPTGHENVIDMLNAVVMPNPVTEEDPMVAIANRKPINTEEQTIAERRAAILARTEDNDDDDDDDDDEPEPEEELNDESKASEVQADDVMSRLAAMTVIQLLDDKAAFVEDKVRTTHPSP